MDLFKSLDCTLAKSTEPVVSGHHLGYTVLKEVLSAVIYIVILVSWTLLTGHSFCGSRKHV